MPPSGTLRGTLVHLIHGAFLLYNPMPPTLLPLILLPFGHLADYYLNCPEVTHRCLLRYRLLAVLLRNPQVGDGGLLPRSLPLTPLPVQGTQAKGLMRNTKPLRRRRNAGYTMYPLTLVVSRGLLLWLFSGHLLCQMSPGLLCRIPGLTL